MANRQDSGSSSAHQNRRPNAQNDDSIPEMGDDVRAQADDIDEDDDEFEDTDDLEDVDDDEEGA